MGNKEDELSKVVPFFNDLVDRLRKLAPNTRNIFSIMIARAHGSEIDLNEIIEVTGKPQSEIVNAVALLEKYELITEPERNENLLPVSYFQQYEMWDMWSAIKDYSELSSISLEEIITNMRFSLLD